MLESDNTDEGARLIDLIKRAITAQTPRSHQISVALGELLSDFDTSSDDTSDMKNKHGEPRFDEVQSIYNKSEITFRNEIRNLANTAEEDLHSQSVAYRARPFGY